MKPNTPERGEHSTPQPRKISPSTITEHPSHSYIETYKDMQIIPPPTIQCKLFERKPLPETLIWKQDKEFERWHNTYTAFIGQQQHLQYILETKFHSIYLQYGSNKYLTLGLANIAQVSPTVKYISVE